MKASIQALLETVPDPVVFVDNNGIVVETGNNIAELVSSDNQDGIVGTRYEDAFEEGFPEASLDEIQQALVAGIPWHKDLTHRSGTTYRVSAAFLEDPESGKCILIRFQSKETVGHFQGRFMSALTGLLEIQTSETTLAQAAHNACTIIAEALGSPLVCIGRYNAERHSMELLACNQVRVFIMHCEDEIFGQEANKAFLTHRTRIVEPEDSKQGPLLVHIPMLSGDRAIGVLTLQDTNGLSKGEGQLEFLDSIAGVAALCLEKTQTDQSLLEAQTQFKGVLEYSAVGQFGFDSEGRILFWNHGCQELFGHKAQTVIGKPVSSILKLTAINDKLDSTLKMIFSGNIHQSQEWNFKKEDGQTVTLRTVNYPVYDGKGNVLLGISASIDITETRQAEEKLGAARDTLRELFDHAEDIIVVASTDGVILNINEKGCTVSGKPINEVIGAHFLNFIHPGKHDEAMEWFENLKADKSTIVDLILLTKDGPKAYSSRGSMFHNSESDSDEAIAILRDVGDIREMEEHIRQSQRLESISILARGVAHEFNNILMGIMGGASLLKRRLPEDSAEHRKAQVIEESSERASMLTNQLLAFARGGKYEPEYVDLSELLAQALDIVKSPIKKIIAIQTDFTAQKLPVRVDRSQMIQVLVNLFQNSAEAIDGKGMAYIQTFRAEPDRLPETLKGTGRVYNAFSYWDNGPGVPPGIRDKVFDPFFTTRGYGRGMGLSAIYGITRNHEGYVTCEEAPTGGAMFTLFFPLVEPDEE